MKHALRNDLWRKWWLPKGALGCEEQVLSGLAVQVERSASLGYRPAVPDQTKENS
jgi:hypothetical protein